MIINKIRAFFSRSIANKMLFAIILLVFLPLFFTIFFTYSKVRVLSQDEFKDYSTQTVKQIEHNISAYLQQMESLVISTAANETVQNYLKLPKEGYELEKIEDITKVKTFENAVRYDRLQSTSLLISGLNGELYNSNGFMMSLDYGYDFNNNVYTKSLEKNNFPFLYLGSHFLEYTFDNRMVFSLVGRIFDTVDNSVLGYIYLDVDYKMFNNIINKVVFSSNDDVMILDGQNIIYSTHANSLLTQADHGLYNVVSASREGSQFLKIGNTQYFFTYTTIKKTGWKIVSLHSMESYNQKASNLIRFIIVISAISLIVAITMAILISLAITKPLINLTTLMRKVENENFNVHFTTNSKDEIATLGEVFNSMIERIRHLVKSVYKSRLMEKDAVILALQSQINPHFLYNTLQSISNIARMEDVQDISSMCQCLSSMFRYNVEGKRRFVMLYDEVAHIRNFIYLHSIQNADHLKFTIDIPDELMNIRIPRFILQPLIENSVSHGLDPKPSGGEVKVYAARNDDVLEIIVEDDGIGIEDERLNEIIKYINEDISSSENLGSKFLALNNVNKRLVLNYGSEYALRIESHEEQGTKVTIRIPIDGYRDGQGPNWA